MSKSNKSSIKRKIHSLNKKYINAETIKLFIILIAAIVMFVNRNIEEAPSLVDLIDVSILISFAFLFMCELIAKLITNYIDSKTEDALKLGTDYNSLVNKYSLNKPHMVKEDCGDKTNYFPAILLALREQDSPALNLVLNETLDGNSIKRYELPSQISDASEAIFSAHDHSITYNNLNIRVDDIKVSGNNVSIDYSYTTYFDSLLTNRAMDYPFRGAHTIREVYEPGPMLSSLSDSKFSNHLGFNGFVELSDGNIIFVHRSNKVSIGKNTLQQSIGASLKTKYCLDENGRLSISGIGKAIKNEIRDELYIDIKDNDSSLTNSIIAFYRDLVEGGKPQFLFYLKYPEMDKEAFINNFKREFAKKKNDAKKKLTVDGERFSFYTLEDIKDFDLSVSSIKDDKGKEFSMMPSSVASIVMLKEYFM